MSQLDVTRHGRVAVLTLKRPDHGNRVSQQMAEEVAAALDKVRTDAATGAAVLTGSSDVYYGMSGLGQHGASLRSLPARRAPAWTFVTVTG